MPNPFLTPVAYGVPFDNSSDGFVSNNTQAAVEEALDSSGGFKPYQVATGLVVNYKTGRAWVNGTAYILTAGTVTVGANLTNNFIYLSVGGVASVGSSIPSNAIPIAQFTSNASAVTSLTDIRGSINNNVQFGTTSDISQIDVGDTVLAGATNRFADAGHQHAFSLVTAEVNLSSTYTLTTSDVLVNGLTTTPAVGTYLVYATGDVTSPTSGAAISLSFYVAGVQHAGSLRKIIPFSGGTLTSGNARGSWAINSVITVTGSQAIEVRGSVSSTGSTVNSGTLTYLRTV